MINFRYHVVSLVAVMLALAVGIALGGGPLQRSADDAPSGSDTETLIATQRELAALEDGTAFADAYALQTADAMLDETLPGRAVTLLTLPGADDAHVERLTELVDRAGGAVTARAALEEKLLDVGNRQLVAELASQLADAVAEDVKDASDASDYEQLALLLGHALVSAKAGGESVDEAGESILAGLATADLLTVTGEVGDRGSLVLVVAGAPYGSADDRQGAGSIMSSMLAVLDGRSDGVVLAGPVASSSDEGVVGAVRADPAAAGAVSTVDAVDRAAGAVVAVLALRAEATGRSGHYGTTEAADGPLPGAGDGS